MNDYSRAVTELARDLVRIDSRSFLSNRALAERIEAELSGFELERLDYRDTNGVEKRALVAHRGPPGGLALSAHMDTVPIPVGGAIPGAERSARVACMGSAALT
jgi:acetylornithine deacetylase